MAITRVGADSAATNTVAVPAGHQRDDYIVVVGFRNSSTTSPTLPSGYTSWTSGSGTTCAMRVATKIATSSAETAPVLTNAHYVAIAVYRGVDVNQMQTVGGGQSLAGAAVSATINYAAITLAVANNTSWVVRMAGHRTATNLLTNTPSGYTNVHGIATGIRIIDTNGPVNTNPTSDNQSVDQSSGWRAGTMEMLANVLMDSLTSTFSDFTSWTADAECSIVNNQLVLTPTGGSAARCDSTAFYGLTESWMYTEMITPNSDTYFVWVSSAGATNYVGFRLNGGNIIFRETVAGVNSDGTPIAYDSIAHRWLRVRVTGGNVLWDTSPDGSTWTNRRTKAVGQAYHRGFAEYYAETGSSGTATFDNFNIVPPATPSLVPPVRRPNYGSLMQM